MIPFLSTLGRRSVWWWLALLAVLLGTGLRVWQWSLGTSFFVDELALLHNVVTRPVGALLTQPLSDSQVAPPLFLLAEKACYLLLGASEQALRLPALLASILALLLLWRVAGRLLWAPLVPGALLALALGYTFIYYGSQAKPYASDAAAALLALELSLRLLARRPPSRRAWGWLALTGLLLPFYSHPAVLVLAGCGAVLAAAAVSQRRYRARRGLVLAVVAVWAVGCAGSAALARHLLPAEVAAYMQFYWQGGMLPLSGQLPQVLYTNLAQRLRYGLFWPSPEVVWLLAAAGGLLVLARQRRYNSVLLLLAPWLVAIAGALLHQFPLSDRQADYLFPGLFVLIFLGLLGVVRAARRRSRPVGALLLLACLLLPLASLRGCMLPPYRVLEVRPLLAWLAGRRRPGDLVYGSLASGQSLRWYGPRYGLPAGSYHVAQCLPPAPGANRQRLRELDAFRGHRVWVVQVFMSHYERNTTLPYLDSLGHAGPTFEAPTRLPEGYVNGAMRVQLFDLRDPARARRYSARSFPTYPDQHRDPAAQRWDCFPPFTVEALQPSKRTMDSPPEPPIAPE